MTFDASRFAGFWRLCSFEQRGQSTTFHPFGPSPSGLIIYSLSGLMSVQLGRSPFPGFHSLDTQQFDPDREPVYSGEAIGSSHSELNLVFDSYLAYYGRYTIDSATSSITHHVEGSNRPDFVGRRLLRLFEFHGSRLFLRPPDSNQMSALLIWEKILI